jgi:signal transduction histidine kinase
LERAGASVDDGAAVDVARVVADVVRRHAGSDGRVVAEPVQPVAVRGDASELARAVENLVENALVHGPPDGRVMVSVAGRLGRVLVTVRDEGPGPDPSEHDRLFERFWRGPGASARPGSGLGLSIVAAIAARHGGEVRVEGSAFTLDLPALEPLNGEHSHVGLTER